MDKWYCFKDKIEMVKTDIRLSYVGISHSIEGLKCPKCGAAYLTEDVVDRVKKGEEELEMK